MKTYTIRYSRTDGKHTTNNVKVFEGVRDRAISHYLNLILHFNTDTNPCRVTMTDRRGKVVTEWTNC